MASRFSVEAIFRAVDKFTAPITQMQNRVGKFTRSLASSFEKANRIINNTAGSIYNGSKSLLKWGGVGLGVVTAGLIGLVREFSKVEDATAAFTPLMGGAEKATRLVEALNKAAADTPFQFETLADATKQLLPVMNGDIENTIRTVKMLGDTAGGNAQKLDSITRGFTKAMLKGKVDLESLNMIGEAGVPIFTALADSMGKKVNPAFFKMISAGKVTTQQLTKAFQDMTAEGGMFYRGMDIASKTTTGMWSTLMDNISLTAASLGEVLAPTVKELIQLATDLTVKIRAWVKTNQEVIRSKFVEYVAKIRDMLSRLLDRFSDLTKVESSFNGLIDVFMKIGDGIAWVVQNAEQIGKFVKWLLVLTMTFKVLAAAATIANIVLLANPIGLIIAAIALLVIAVSGLIIWWDELTAAFNNLPEWVKTSAMILAAPFLAIVEAIKVGLSLIGMFVDKVKGVAQWAGFFKDADVDVNHKSESSPQVVSPYERNARAIEESRTTNYAELLIKDTTGKATLENGKNSPGIGFSMIPTGAF